MVAGMRGLEGLRGLPHDSCCLWELSVTTMPAKCDIQSPGRGDLVLEPCAHAGAPKIGDDDGDGAGDDDDHDS